VPSQKLQQNWTRVIGLDKDETVIKELSPYLVVAAQADLYKLTKDDLLSLGIRNVDLQW